MAEASASVISSLSNDCVLEEVVGTNHQLLRRLGPGGIHISTSMVAQVTIVSIKPGQIQGVRHDLDKTINVKVDRTIRDVSADEFDAVHLPGGTVNADTLRMVPEVQAFLQAMQEAGKSITAICHAAWELMSAGLVRGRTLTSYHSIQEDIRNAGGCWMDWEVVEDANWVTSRQPDDLPAFNRAMLTLFWNSLVPSGK
jgi:protease I